MKARTVTIKDWDTSDNATAMLRALLVERSALFRRPAEQLHRFLIACCWKHEHLIPQDGLRYGLKGAEEWIDGKIDDDELDRLNYYAEAEAFCLDYAETPEELATIGQMIKRIPKLSGMTFGDARDLLTRAAYFAEGVMYGPNLRPGPWFESMYESEFLCADILREHVKPELS